MEELIAGTFTLFCWGFAMLIAGWKLHERHVRNPYRWTCRRDGCEFSCGSSVPDWTLTMAEKHTQGHIDQEEKF